MFLLAFIVFGLPCALIALVGAGLAAHWLRLMPDGLSFSWLAIPTMGLAAGGAIAGFAIEELVVRPFELQSELLGRQVATPLSLRSYSAWGFQDPGWTWTYEIGADEAAALARQCPPEPPAPRRTCALPYDPGRSLFVDMEGTKLTLQESFM